MAAARRRRRPRGRGGLADVAVEFFAGFAAARSHPASVRVIRRSARIASGLGFLAGSRTRPWPMPTNRRTSATSSGVAWIGVVVGGKDMRRVPR